eukprot:SAG31_NODE_828_length_11716_cov_4.405785_13_plen_80_part_00
MSLSTVSVNNQSPLVQVGRMKQRLASKVHSNGRQCVTIIDTTTQQRIRADSPLFLKSMRMNGVDMQQVRANYSQLLPIS